MKTTLTGRGGATAFSSQHFLHTHYFTVLLCKLRMLEFIPHHKHMKYRTTELTPFQWTEEEMSSSSDEEEASVTSAQKRDYQVGKHE